MKAALVIMAAGMGSRYGGSKQVDGIGPNHEILMEYSVFDAVRAGFTKVVFIIKPEMLDLMKDLCGDRVSQMKAKNGDNVEVCYAFQDFTSVPKFYAIPPERVKPFGTAHAVLCAREFVSEPFVVINADDYYGVDAFETIYAELSSLPGTGAATMVGYSLCNTVSENGTVTRGICHVTDGRLDKIVETFKLKEEVKERVALKQAGRSKVKISVDKYIKPIGGNDYLMVCEGLSARGGVSAALGRNGFGYYASRGVGINAYDATSTQLLKNQEFSAKRSFVALTFIDRRYLMAKTAVVRVLPSRNG